MDTLAASMNFILPILGIILLSLGIARKNLTFVIVCLWVSLFALLIQYHIAGDEILGSYFNYINAATYTLDVLLLLASILYIFSVAPIFHGKYSRYISGLIVACLATSGFILIINLWMNARFIEERLPGSAIMQVVTFTPPSYCSYRYVFYKVDTHNQVSYLCPNHYGLIPAIGHLDVAPDFLVHQLAQRMHKKN